MKAVSMKTYNVVTPEDDQYSELAVNFGATFQHIAQKIADPKHLELLPVTYKVISKDGKRVMIRHAKP